MQQLPGADGLAADGSRPSLTLAAAKAAAARAEVERLRLLAEDWDSYGGAPPAAAAIEAAKAFLDALYELPFAALLRQSPHVLAAGDGSVGLQWYRDPEHDVEIVFDGQTISYVLSHNGVVEDGCFNADGVKEALGVLVSVILRDA
jgi:hypothetical protein